MQMKKTNKNFINRSLLVSKKYRYFSVLIEREYTIQYVNNMKKLYLLIALVVPSLFLTAQQEAQFTQHNYAILPFNPGYAGSNGAICLTSLVRQQWMGFKDPNGVSTSPQTLLFTLDAPVKILKGGLGLTVMKDQLGYENNINLKLGYAYRLNIGMGTLGIGLQGGFQNKTIDFSKFVPIQDGDLRLINRNQESDMIFDLSFGLFYKVPNQYYVGLASTQMLQQEGNLSSTGVELKRHYFITGGYEWVYPEEPSLVLEPSVNIKTDFVSAQYDIMAIAKWDGRFWGGLSYRFQDAVAMVLGVRPFETGSMAGLHIGYSYDFTTSDLGRKGRSIGSHEIMLRYCFNIERPPVFHSYKNTRMLGN
jgi:type IX secretion system PorP/SprF family membrane protein